MTQEVKEAIRNITSDCSIRKLHKSDLRSFRLKVGTDDMIFNHRVQVDTMFLDGRPVIHLVDLETQFFAAAFIKSQSTDEIWRRIQRFWTLVYMGPSEFLEVDQGTLYVSRDMKINLSASGKILKEAPIELPNCIGTVERYNSPFRAAYKKFREDLDRTQSDA